MEDNLTFSPPNTPGLAPSKSIEQVWYFLSLSRHLWCYLWPVIFTVGLAGNMLTVLILRRRHSRLSCADEYLGLLAIADTCALVVGLGEYMDIAWYVNILQLSPWSCRTMLFLYYTIFDTTVWILVAFTLERVRIVRTPCLTPYSARYVRSCCGVLLAVAVAKEVHLFWMLSPVSDNGRTVTNCGVQRRYVWYMSRVSPWIQLMLVAVLPLLAIISGNAVIIRTLRSKTVGSTGRLIMQQNVAWSIVSCLRESCAVLISAVLISAHTPVLRQIDPERFGNNQSIAVAYVMCVLLRYAFHAGNFFLYCVIGRDFRQELRELTSFDWRHGCVKVTQRLRTLPTALRGNQNNDTNNILIEMTTSVYTDSVPHAHAEYHGRLESRT
ncbi:hypothetical protein NP493_14g03070 [Ridgeia piscesae]|uniref:G-protein coupled receptors family 1 profile domain-containing protein n=1 Tax=Ridgeia piscesae TaxID=27915 RepID=A0AAD9PE79_RIDPI|nr:hypothetical protein NP493_14g03070 [Ridgeia piscesae]